jgi:hypothetical protein
LRALYEPLLIDVAARSYIDGEGLKHEAKGPPIWTHSLAEKVCLVDLDTRSEEELRIRHNAQQLEGITAGMLNHFAYGESTADVEHAQLD